jgi:hypothetical protein
VAKKLTKGDNFTRAAAPVEIPSLDATATMRPMTAAQMFTIEGGFPTDRHGRIANFPGYMRAMIADTVVDDSGAPVFTAADLETLDTAAFWELWGAVSVFLGINRKADAKN